MTGRKPEFGKSIATDGPLGTLVASFSYWTVVLAAGFILGSLRVLALTPAFGETAAVALELPVMLAVSWIASRGICRRVGVPARLPPRLWMGGVAFALLMATEGALAVYGFGRTVGEWAVSLGTPVGLLGLAGQVVFATIPAIQAALRPET